jgi:transcription-repair coupling factor (superfamily II helicase)
MDSICPKAADMPTQSRGHGTRHPASYNNRTIIRLMLATGMRQPQRGSCINPPPTRAGQPPRAPARNESWFSMAEADLTMSTADTGPPTPDGLDSLPRLLHAAEGWASLRAALDARLSGTVDGAWGSSAALAVAALAIDAPATVVVVLPGVSDVPAWTADLTSFAGKSPAVFEAWETWPPPTHRGQLDPATSSRLRLLQALALDPPKLVVTTVVALIQPVPARDDLAHRGRKLTTGEVVEPSELAEWLVANGYKRVEAVEYPGEFGRRGGICDIFPPDATDPVRLEFFGDELESIRTFSAGSQRSLETKDAVTLLCIETGAGYRGADVDDLNPADPTVRAGQKHLGSARSNPEPRPSNPETRFGVFTDYLPPQSRIVLVEPGDLKEQAKLFFERVSHTTGLWTTEGLFANLLRHPTVTVSALPRPSVEASVHLRVESVERFSGNVQRVRDELDAVASGATARVLIACQTDAECHRLTDVLKAGQLSQSNRLQPGDGTRPGWVPAGRGWEWSSSVATNCSTRTNSRTE